MSQPPTLSAWIGYPCNADGSMDPATIRYRIAKVEAFSAEGVRITLPGQVVMGTMVSVELMLGENRFSRQMVARVTRMTAAAPGAWAADCDWVNGPSEKDLSTWLT